MYNYLGTYMNFVLGNCIAAYLKYVYMIKKYFSVYICYR